MGSLTMLGQRHSQCTPTSLGQGCTRVNHNHKYLQKSYTKKKEEEEEEKAEEEDGKGKEEKGERGGEEKGGERGR